MAKLVTQLQVGEYRIGIIGLESVFTELARTHGHEPDEVIREALITQISRKNYIALNLKPLFEAELLKQFKQFQDHLTSTHSLEARRSTMDIKVLGPGCPKCEQTEKNVMDAVAETGADASVEKIKDVMQIAKFGVFGTPAVVIDGDVKCVGKVPTKEQVKAWIEK